MFFRLYNMQKNKNKKISYMTINGKLYGSIYIYKKEYTKMELYIDGIKILYIKYDIDENNIYKIIKYYDNQISDIIKFHKIDSKIKTICSLKRNISKKWNYDKCHNIKKIKMISNTMNKYFIGNYIIHNNYKNYICMIL